VGVVVVKGARGGEDDSFLFGCICPNVSKLPLASLFPNSALATLRRPSSSLLVEAFTRLREHCPAARAKRKLYPASFLRFC